MIKHDKALLVTPLSTLLAAICISLAMPASLHAQEDGAADASGPRKGRKRKGRDGRRRGKKAQPAQSEAPPPADEPAADEPAGEAPASKLQATPQGGSLRRSNKMEFDARLVRGETAGTGAVVLFDRGQRELPPLTAKRTGFLRATVEEIYGEHPPVPASRPGKRARARARGRGAPAAPAAAVRREEAATEPDSPAAAAPGQDGD